MSFNMSCSKEFIELLENDAEFLYQYPTCSYLIPLMIEHFREFKITEVPETTIKDFNDYFEILWNEISSAISIYVPISLQLDLVKKISFLILNFIRLINRYDKKEAKFFGDYWYELRENWEKDFFSLVQEVQFEISKYKRPKGKLYEREIIHCSDKDWKNSLFDLIYKNDLLNESEKPSYLLKSGYRSLYFFNSMDLTHPDIWQKFIKILSQFLDIEVEKKLIELLEETYELNNKLEQYKQKGLKGIIEIIPITKMNGENLGTSVFMSGLASLGFIQRDITPPSRFGLSRLRGPEVEEGLLSVVLDDVAMRGVGIRENIERLEKAKHTRPFLYLLIIDRSREGFNVIDNIPLLSMVDRYDLIQSRLWIPEILCMSLESALWPGLDLMNDPLREICAFSNTKNQYNTLFNRFKSLLTDFYEIKGNSNNVILFDFPTGLTDYELSKYLMNIHILCWNVFFPLSFRVGRPTEYIDGLINLEHSEKITIDSCIITLKDGFKKLEIKSLEKYIRYYKDIIHRIFTINKEFLLNELKNKYESRLKIYMGESFELYSDEELEILVSDAMESIKERWKQEGTFEKYQKYEQNWRRDLIEAYKMFNTAFGKQRNNNNNINKPKY